MASKSKMFDQLGGSAHWSQQDKRSRADSVLGNRMDELHDFRKLKSSHSTKWRKLRRVIDKEHSKLMLIEVPKNVSAGVFIYLNVFVVRH